MTTQILIETLNPTSCNLITEAAVDGKDCYLRGIFMQSEIVNRNGRKYPLVEISRAVEAGNRMIKEQNGIFGELDHPQTLTINLDRISHVITELKMDGTNAIGKAKIIDTPMGNIARKLIESGVRLGVSSRGAGSVNNEGIVEGFNFITVDIVATPSAQGAIPESIYESLMNDAAGYKAVSLAEQVKHDKAAQKFLETEIRKFITDCIQRKIKN